MYCRNCGSQQPNSAKVCSNCGCALNEIEPAKNVEDNELHLTKSNIIMIVVGCCILLGIFIASTTNGNSSSGNNSKNNAASTTKTVAYSDEDRAWDCAKQIVGDNIISPSTASYKKLKLIKLKGNDKSYKVFGSVDAQNSMGATIRNYFEVNITLLDDNKFNATNPSITTYDTSVYYKE